MAMPTSTAPSRTVGQTLRICYCVFCMKRLTFETQKVKLVQYNMSLLWRLSASEFIPFPNTLYAGSIGFRSVGHMHKICHVDNLSRFVNYCAVHPHETVGRCNRSQFMHFMIFPHAYQYTPYADCKPGLPGVLLLCPAYRLGIPPL